VVDEHARPARFEPKMCGVCGESFRSMNQASKYCSRSCRTQVEEARRRKMEESRRGRTRDDARRTECPTVPEIAAEAAGGERR